MKNDEPVHSRSAASRLMYFVCVVALAVAAGVLACIAYSYWQGQDSYEKVEQVAFESPLTETVAAAESESDELQLADLTVDWDALRAVNPDVVGWVYVPDTPISYPIVHSHDNDEYLYVNFNGEYGNGWQPTYGTPFLMAQNAEDFSDPVNIIQAHNMANGTMFAEIPKFADAETFAAHRTAYVLTPQGNYRLVSVSVLVGDAYDAAVQTSFDSRESYTAYVQDVLARSVVTPDSAVPTAEDVGRLFLLSTCTSDGYDRRVMLVCAVAEYVEIVAGQTAS